MVNSFTDAELEAYLEETLDPRRAAQIEQAARQDAQLLKRLAEINNRRDAGVHTLGEIWRRGQIGVPTRDEMGSYVLGVLEPERMDYIRFRLELLKCPFTLALYNDLVEQQSATAETATQSRRRKYYESSAGMLNRRRKSQS